MAKKGYLILVFIVACFIFSCLVDTKVRVFANVTKTISNSKGLISLSVENATFNIMRNPTFKTAMIRYVSGYYKIIKDFILG